MPDYSNLSIIVDTAITESYSYTATEDGWLHVNVQSTNSAAGQLAVTINNTYTFVLCTPVGYLQQSQILLVKKGDTVHCGLSSGLIRNIIFIPCI